MVIARRFVIDSVHRQDRSSRPQYRTSQWCLSVVNHKYDFVVSIYHRKRHIPLYAWLAVLAVPRALLSRLSLDQGIRNISNWQDGCREPVAKAMPQIPPGNPILFVDIGHVSAHVVVWLGMRTGVSHHRQDLEVLRGLRNLIPFVRGCHRRIRPGLICKVALISTQSISCGLSFPLR